MISEANGSTEPGGYSGQEACEFTIYQLGKINKAGQLPSAVFGPDLLQQCFEMHPEQKFLQLDGFIHALIGSTFVGKEEVLVYSYGRMVKILQLRDSMSRGEAEEFIDFNCPVYPGEADGVFYPIIMDF